MDPKDKEQALSTLRYSPLLERLREILSDFERDLQVTKNDYDSPSWSHRQAHQNGMLEAYRKIKSLLDHKETK